MSDTPPEDSPAVHTGTPWYRRAFSFAFNRIRADKDFHAGGSTIKRVVIQLVVSAFSFVLATWIAFELELWLHHLEEMAETDHIEIPHFFKVVYPYVTGTLFFGLSIIATCKAFKESWHIGSPAAEKGPHQAGALVTTPPAANAPASQGAGNRAERRRRDRK